MYRLTYNSGQSALRDIVDYVGSELLNASTCHKRTIGVDADHGIGLFTAHYLKGMLQACRLLLHAHNVGSGTCREGTDIDDAPAFGNDLVGAVGYLCLGLLARTAVERVGGGIEYAHNHGSGEVNELAPYINSILHCRFLLRY